jgi:hypothetical protein
MKTQERLRGVTRRGIREAVIEDRRLWKGLRRDHGCSISLMVFYLNWVYTVVAVSWPYSYLVNNSSCSCYTCNRM